MKNTIIVCLCLLAICSAAAKCEGSSGRGLFVTVMQDPPVLSSREAITRLIEFAKKARVKVLFIQIYQANKAWFPSKIADPKPYEKCIKDLSEDPLRLLIKKAHESGIEVHAWLNMLSLGVNNNSVFIKKYGPGILTRNVRPKKKIEDYKIDNQYFLEPGDPRTREDLVGIVEEVVRAYPELDGIQFDYVRYPDTKPAYGHTDKNVERFRKATGIKKIREDDELWKKWKRDQVTEVMALVSGRARSLHPGMQISATGCMPYSRAYYEAFQDWPSWVRSGLVDFVTLMDYSSDPKEFEKWVITAKSKVEDIHKLNIGVGAYKLASSIGVFEREFGFAENAGVAACVIFHYGSLEQSPALSGLLVNADRPRGTRR